MSEVKRYTACIDGIPVGRQVVLAEDFDAINQRLTVAEQLLSEALCHAQRMEPISASLFNRIDSAIEISSKLSVEPSHACDGCGSSGWTGNCDKCIPY